jgi:SAM-dependent methyltransferase
MNQKPYLHLGAGTITLPGTRPAHHHLIDAAIYDYPLWHNVDKNKEVGIDETVDLFTYPWPWKDNSFDGALLAHLVEHIPHAIHTRGVSERAVALSKCQDGWYAFMAELYRVLTPGAVAHILCPYGWSNGAITDPSHTRLITEQTFTHSLTPSEEGAPFRYNTAHVNLRLMSQPTYTLTPMFAHLQEDPQALLEAFQTRINVAYEIYVRLEAIK